MNVLSLCDGMSCAQIALKELGIEVDNYYASEIDKNAIKVTQENFPHTIQLGDVTQIDEEVLSKLPRIDLVCFGSPCRSLSKATIAHDGYHDGLKGISRIFFNCVHILNWIKENNNKDVYFLVENVDSDNKADLGIMTKCLGFEPILVNSGDFSAQNRVRNYWTNIPIIPHKGYNVDNSVLKDIMLDSCEVDDKYWYTQKYSEVDMSKSICCYLDINGHDILKRVQNPNFKCATLTACRGGNHQKKVLQDGRVRKLTPIEYMRLQGVPSWYKMNVADSHVYNMCGDGWNIKTIEWLIEGIKK